LTERRDAPVRRRLIVGTRGSALALAQTEEAIAPLRQKLPDTEILVEVIRTTGDREASAPLSQIGGQGVFVKEIERALLDCRVDLAVHSLKDLPPRMPLGLHLAAIPTRTDPHDALISRNFLTLAHLPPGSRIGTSSSRRRALLMNLRRDVDVVELRGNVETRIGRVRDGTVDATVLAVAGLTRLGLQGEAAEVFSPDTMIPAPGQGALAIEARDGDAFVREVAALLDDSASRLCAVAERGFLARLGSGCNSPVGAYATLTDGRITLRAFLARPDGTSLRTASIGGVGEDAEALGERVAEMLLAGD
jgi:hydroxymethylbilane synthase